MNARATAVAAAVALTCAGATAAAADVRRPVRPAVCNLVVDPAADVYPRQDQAVDILSADIASNATHVTAAIRLAGPPGALQQSSPTGQSYRATFKGAGKGITVFLNYVVTPTGSTAFYGFFDPQNRVYRRVGQVPAKVAGNVVYVTAPLSALKEWSTLTPGTRITAIAARTAVLVGYYLEPMNYTYTDYVDADVAPGKVAYVAGTSSCVKVGG